MNNNEFKINLKQRIAETERQSLNGLVSFTAQKLNENSLNELAALAELLEKIGITLDVTRKNNSDTGISYDLVVLKLKFTESAP